MPLSRMKLLITNSGAFQLQRILKLPYVLQDDDLDVANHHIRFKTWIDELCKDRYHNYATIVSLCEEKIAKHEDCICFYMIYLCALAPYELCSAVLLADRLRSVIRRGIMLARNGCDGMLSRFLEHSFLVASRLLYIQTFRGKLLCYCLSMYRCKCGHISSYCFVNTVES